MSEWSTVSTNADAAGLSPVDVEQKLVNLVNTLSTALAGWRDAYKIYKDAELAYDMAYARARVNINTDIAYNDRKYHADLATQDERAAKDDAETVFKYADKRLEGVRQAISAWQSLNKSIQMAYMNAERSNF